MSETMRLIDDGTMDTVFQCRECGDESRYTYDGGEESGETYDQFKAWAHDDANETHECPECHGHESLEGPIGNVVYCNGACRPRLG